MRLTSKELGLVIDEARRRYIELSAETRLVGEHKTMSESERVAYSYLIAALGLFQRRGLEAPETEYPDYEPDTEP